MLTASAVSQGHVATRMQRGGLRLGLGRGWCGLDSGCRRRKHRRLAWRRLGWHRLRWRVLERSPGCLRGCRLSSGLRIGCIGELEGVRVVLLTRPIVCLVPSRRSSRLNSVWIVGRVAVDVVDSDVVGGVVGVVHAIVSIVCDLHVRDHVANVLEVSQRIAKVGVGLDKRSLGLG